jgi:anti-anti-sigma factor
MSFHFCAHSWEVRHMTDGTQVKLSRRDLDAESVSELVDDLAGLALETGSRNLYLDFADVDQLASVVIGKLVALNGKLGQHGGRLIVLDVQPSVYEMFRAACLTDVLDLRPRSAAETLF